MRTRRTASTAILKVTHQTNAPLQFHASARNTMLHHLMIGTWTPPGAIFTVAFDDEALTLKLVKRTEIPTDEPISWMTFDVSYLRYILSL